MIVQEPTISAPNFCQYRFVRPINKSGEFAGYFNHLKSIMDGKKLTWNNTRNMGQQMTFQALREAGLIRTMLLPGENTKIFVLTDMGLRYVAYHLYNYNMNFNIVF